MDADIINKTIDLTGLRCPNLLFSIINALDDMEDGQLLKIIATDLNAPSNTAVWCRQSDNELVDIYEEHEKFVVLIKRAACQHKLQPDALSTSPLI